MITKYAQHAKKLPGFTYKLLAQSWIDKEWPRHIFIETTANCNLTCSYCPREDISKEMDFDIFKQIVDEASHYGARSFSLHLFGEPLLYSHWQEAINYIKLQNSNHTVLLTTNGTLLNKQVDAVIMSRVDKVIWSWRPEAKFTQETKEKLRKWGRFQVRILKQVTPKRAWEEWKDWRPIEVKNLHNYGGNIELGKFGVLSADNGQRYPCYHLWYAPAVAWNGDILICCNDPHHREVIGHFPEMSIAQAWKSPRLEELRNAHLSGKYPSICQGCDVWKTYPDLWFNHQKKSL